MRDDSFNGDGRDEREGAFTAFDPLSLLVRYGRIIINTQVNGGSDLVTYTNALEHFAKAAAVVYDLGENEILAALKNFEMRRLTEDKRDKRRPGKVTAPLRGGAALIRVASTRPGKVRVLYRRYYGPVIAEQRAQRPEPRRRTYNPAA